MKSRSSWALMLPVALVCSMLTVLTPTVAATPAAAASSADFNAGYIISDENFYDGSAMSAAEVQSFLNSKLSRCTIGDPGRAPGTAWGSSRIAQNCLKDYRSATSSRAANAYCAAYRGESSETAAQIIAKVANVCGISAKALIILLEKEQSLVTDSWPTVTQIERAMGYACPDSGPNNSANCDPAQFGFVHQVYMAAWQFRAYKAQPTSYNYIAGRNNNIQYHPNAACGASAVFIQNAATAGLYNYTPYQPNRAALNNLYGLGDSCSAYGNRNFWVLYSDWFGAPTESSSLVKSASSATVFLTSGSVKYPIASQAVLAALAPLGKVSEVSESHLSRYETKHNATQILRGPDGSIYFTGSGIKLPFSSCELVGHYGGSCAATGYVQLDAIQISRFTTGPSLSRVMGTSEGSRYYLENGKKREILDFESQNAAGISGSINVLNESALGSIPFGTPIVRGSVVVGQFDSASLRLLDNSVRAWELSSAEAAESGLSAMVAGRLRAQSNQLLTAAGQQYMGALADTNEKRVVLMSGKKMDWVPGVPGTLQAPVMSDAFLARIPQGPALGVGSFVKAPTNGTIYLLASSTIRPIGSWETLVSMSDLGNPTFTVIPTAVVASQPTGPVALEAATLVRSESNATVYLINGITNKIPISSFDPATEAGITRFSYTLQERITAYPSSGAVLEYGLTCGGVKYLAVGGKIRPVSDTLAAQFPFQYLELDQYVCRNLKVGDPAVGFVRTPDGSIFQILGGQKRHVTSMSRLYELDLEGRGWMNVSARFGQMIPTGPGA